MERMLTIKYLSSPNLETRALKSAHSLLKLKCITKGEYELIKSRIEHFPTERKRKKEQLAREQQTIKILGYLWTVFMFVLFILTIPLRIVWWFFQAAIYGVDKVSERDLMEGAMHRVKHDDD